MTKRKSGIILSGILLLLACSLIFCLSARTGGESDTDSAAVISIFPGFLTEFVSIIYKVDSAKALLIIDSFIRNCAHFGEFGFLCAVCVFHFKLTEINRPFLFGFIFSAIYSVFDEIHQYFVPGRTFQITDIITDICGVAAALLLCLFINSFYKKRIKK